MPRLLQRSDQSGFGKSIHDVFSTIGQSNLSKVVEETHSCRVEVSFRHCWICLPLALEKSLDIPPVFLQQGLRTVLWMALEMNEQAPLLFLDKRIHAALGRLSQHRVAIGGQFIRTHFVPSR